MEELIKTSRVELRIVEGKGRCLFLTTSVKKGDVIFEEAPLISCQFAWNKCYKYLACDYCMRPLENVEENIVRLSNGKCFELPFLECDSTVKESHCQCQFCEEDYCSEVCRQTAWNHYHKFLCHKNDESEPLVQLVERWKLIHYPPETLNIMLLARIIAHIQLAENKTAVYNTYMQFCHLAVNNDENLSHKLLQDKFKYDIDELWRMFATILQPKCDEFNKNEFTDTLLTREGFIRLLTLYGRNGQAIGTSPLAIWAKTVLALDVSAEVKNKIQSLVDMIYDAVDEHVGSFDNSEGSGLYVMQSCINHSCAPNAKIVFPFNTTRLTVKAKRDILAGEEIVISYLDKCSLNRSCHSRRALLRENYLFTCECSKCIADSQTEADVTSEDDDDDEDVME